MRALVALLFKTERSAHTRSSRTPNVQLQSARAAVLGEPDEIRTLHEPKVKNGKIVGYTHWYIIRRLVKNGSAAQKQESLVRVSFDLDDRVSKVDAWGL